MAVGRLGILTDCLGTLAAQRADHLRFDMSLYSLCSVAEFENALRDPEQQSIDVREVAEWNDAHVVGATLAPLSELPVHLAGLSRAKPVWVLCRSGMRAQRAAQHMVAEGFSDVRVVEGGILAWAESGREVVRGA